MNGTVTGIFVAESAGADMTEVETAKAIAGQGLEGDRYQRGEGFYTPVPGARQLTLIEEENLSFVLSQHKVQLAAKESRRNVSTRGIRLNDLVGKRFTIGEVLCAGIRLCPPCNRLKELTEKQVLGPMIDRGGLRADIISTGVIRRGDVIREVTGSSQP